MRDEVRTRLSRAAKLAAVLAALSVAVSGCGVFDVLRLGWPSGVTPQASAMRDLWIWSIVAALIVGVIVWGLMLWTIIFHRRKADDDDLPRQFQYNLPLEIIYTVIPLVIVTALFAVTVLVQNYVDTDRPDPDVRVDVTAFQWNWAFQYPDKTDFTGRPVTTLGTSNRDPDHGAADRSADRVHARLARRHPLVLGDRLPVQAGRVPPPGEERHRQRLAGRQDRARGARSSAGAPSCAAPTMRS